MKKNQEKVWDAISGDWRKFRGTPVKEAIDFLKDKKGNILDLACGSGRNFCKVDGTLYGVDFSKEMLKNAKKYAKDMGFDVILKKSSADKLPFSDNFFDACIFIASLHCVDTEEKRKNALKELYRVLKPGSEILLTVWNKDQPKFRKEKKEMVLAWTVDGPRRIRYYYLYEKNEIRQLLESTGYKVTKILDHEDSDSFTSQRNLVVYAKK